MALHRMLLVCLKLLPLPLPLPLPAHYLLQSQDILQCFPASCGSGAVSRIPSCSCNGVSIYTCGHVHGIASRQNWIDVSDTTPCLMPISMTAC